MAHVDLKPLPFTSAGFHFSSSISDETLDAMVGKTLSEDYAQYMNWIGSELCLCSASPILDAMSDIRLAMFNDAGMTDFAGSFVIYGVQQQALAYPQITVSVMLAPSFSGYPSTEWVTSYAEVLAFILKNDLPCENGLNLNIAEVRFPQVSNGDPYQNQWFIDPSIDLARRAELIAIIEAEGLTVTSDNDLLPISVEVQGA